MPAFRYLKSLRSFVLAIDCFPPIVLSLLEITLFRNVDYIDGKRKPTGIVLAVNENMVK
jgi:hypothetical protein